MNKNINIAEIASLYEGFIVDLWGVVHNGIAPYPGVVNTLKRIKQQNKVVVFLSNSPRRHSDVATMLNNMGVGESCYDGLYTSGEFTYDYLRTKENIGKNIYHIGPSRNNSVLANLKVTDDPGNAELILCSGISDDCDVDNEKQITNYYQNLLQCCAENKIPLLCSNPDMRALVGDVTFICAGFIASLYQKLGGEVIYVGKPYLPIYEHLWQKHFRNMGKKDVIAIGDSILTDIKGAANFAIDSILVNSGLQSLDNSISCDKNIEREYGYKPTYIMQQLNWP